MLPHVALRMCGYVFQCACVCKVMCLCAHLVVWCAVIRFCVSRRSPKHQKPLVGALCTVCVWVRMHVRIYVSACVCVCMCCLWVGCVLVRVRPCACVSAGHQQHSLCRSQHIHSLTHSHRSFTEFHSRIIDRNVERCWKVRELVLSSAICVRIVCMMYVSRMCVYDCVSGYSVCVRVCVCVCVCVCPNSFCRLERYVALLFSAVHEMGPQIANDDIESV